MYCSIVYSISSNIYNVSIACYCDFCKGIAENINAVLKIQCQLNVVKKNMILRFEHCDRSGINVLNEIITAIIATGEYKLVYTYIYEVCVSFIYIFIQ